MEIWRLITTWGADPAFNMGLDEALLENADAPTTLRLYTWKPDTLSLGYFQRVADVPGALKVPALVRRITGGGAIHHKNELTFSIAASLDHPLYRGNIAESYVRVHDAIRAALREYGIESELRGARALASDCVGTGMCFHKSTDLDIVWNERKGVGSAQRRRASRVLHHGSIKLGSTPLEGEIATIQAFAPDVAVDGLALVLRASFEQSFGIAFEAAVPEVDERTRARELGKRYTSRVFIDRR